MKRPLIALLAMAPLAAPAMVRATELPPFEATYEMRLTHASETGGPRAMAGSYEYRVEQTCDGWETKSHMLLDLAFRDDTNFTNERFFSSWEDKTGSAYRFTTQTVKNGLTVEAFKGTAAVTRKGGDATYESLIQPGRKVTLHLPLGTMLPMAHARALLEHAEQGDQLFRSVVMNGSFSTGPRVLSIAIGRRHDDDEDIAPEPHPRVDLDAKLIATPSWQMSSALFNLGEKRDTPNTEMFVQLHETGIAQYFEQTFQDFALSATLVKLKHLDPPKCG
jgi:hypothetical protein